MRTKQVSRLLAFLLAAMMLLSGCGKEAAQPDQGTAVEEPAGDTAKEPAAEEPAAEEPAEAADEGPAEAASEETLRVIIPSEPGNIMPLSAEAGEGQWIAWCMYDRLVNYDSDTKTIVPGLATEWEWVDDTHIRFHLRDDAVAYDGTTITADDVMFSIQRGLEGDATTQWAVVDGNECKAEDPQTVVIGLKEPYPTIVSKLSYVAQLSVIDESSVEALGGYEEAIRNPKCTSGAYFFDEWVAGEYIRLVRNEDYWGEPGYYKNIEFTWSDDSTARMLAVAAGDVDFAVNINSADLLAASGYENCVGYTNNGGGTRDIFFNVTNEYLQNEKVREAIYYALDTEYLNNVGTNGTSKVADSIISSASPYYKAPDASFDRSVNVEKAKELLAEAGYADGFTLRLPCAGDARPVAEAVQASLAEIGITVQVESMERPTFLAATDVGDFDIVAQPTFPDDMISYVKYYDNRMELNTRGGGIVGGYEDMYDIIDRCKYTIDEEENLQAWGELQDYVREHSLTVPMYETAVFYCAGGEYEYSNFSNGHIIFSTVRPAA